MTQAIGLQIRLILMKFCQSVVQLPGPAGILDFQW